jgi:hypothetical protein
MATRAVLRGRVESSTGRTDKTTVINDGLQEGLEECLRRHLFRDLKESADVTINSADYSCALPSGLLNVFQVELINGTSSFTMTLWTKEKFQRAFPDLTTQTSALPYWAWVDLANGLLKFSPSSNGTYAIRFSYTSVPDFVSDSDTSPVGVDAALAWATSYLFRSIQQYEDAEHWEMVFNRRLASAIAMDVRDNVERVHEGFHRTESPSPLNPWEDPFNMGRRE